MFKTNLFIFLSISCAHTFAASTRSHKEEADILDRGLSKVEAFKNVTISELPPKQLQIVDNVAQKLNVTLDDMQLSMRLYAADAPWLRQLNAQSDIIESFNAKAREVELNDPKEVSIEYLTKNHPKLMKLANEIKATNDEILIFVRFGILSRRIKKNIRKEIQYETSICPVPPEEINENPSSDQIQKYIRLAYSLDFTSKMTLTARMVQFVKKICIIPDSIMETVVGMAEVWAQFNMPYVVMM